MLRSIKRIGKVVSRADVASIAAIVLIAAYNARGIFFANGFPGGTDALIYVVEASYVHYHGLTTWYTWYTFGQPSTFFQSPLIDLMGLSWSPTYAYYVATLSLFCSAGFGIYIIARRASMHSLPALLSAIIYMNSQIMFSELWEGHVDILFGFAFLPVVLYLGYILPRLSPGRVGLVSLFFVFYLFGAQETVAYMAALTLPMVFVAGAYVYRESGYKFKGLNLGLLLLFTVVVSSYFWVPYMMGASPIYITTEAPLPAGIVSTPGLLGSISGTSTEVSNANFWLGQTYTSVMWPYLQNVSIGGLILFGLAIISCMHRRSVPRMALLLAGLCSVVVATGTESPFGFLFQEVWNFVPYFNYDPFVTRWLVFLSLSEALLVGLLVQDLMRDGITSHFPLLQSLLSHLKFKKISLRAFQAVSNMPRATARATDRKKDSVAIVTLILTILCAVVMSCPLSYIAYPKAWNLPAEFSQAEGWLRNNSNGSQVMIVPYGGVYERSSDFGVSRSPADIIPMSTNSPIFDGEGGTGLTRTFSDALGYSVLDGTARDLPSVIGGFGIKYLLFAKPTNDQNFSNGSNQISSNWNPDYSYSFLLNQTGMTPIDQFGNVDLFKVNYTEPTVYAVPNLTNVLGGERSVYLDAALSGGRLVPALNPLDLSSASLKSEIPNHPLLIVDQNFSDLGLGRGSNSTFYASQLNATVTGPTAISNWWSERGYSTLSGDTLRLGKNASILVPQSSRINSTSLWVRVAKSPQGGVLRATWGDKSSSINLWSSVPEGFTWIQLAGNISSSDRVRLTAVGSEWCTSSSDDCADIDAVEFLSAAELNQSVREADSLVATASNFVYVDGAASPALSENGFYPSPAMGLASDAYFLNATYGGTISLSAPSTGKNYYVTVSYLSSPLSFSDISVVGQYQHYLIPGLISSILNESQVVVLGNSTTWMHNADDSVSYSNTSRGQTIGWNLSQNRSLTSDFIYFPASGVNLTGSQWFVTSILGDRSGNYLGMYIYDRNGMYRHYFLTNPNTGINWNGWRNVSINVDDYSSQGCLCSNASSTSFGLDNISAVTFEYTHNTSSVPSSTLSFTPYRFIIPRVPLTSQLVSQTVGPFSDVPGAYSSIQIASSSPVSLNYVALSNLPSAGQVASMLTEQCTTLGNENSLSESYQGTILNCSNGTLVLNQAFNNLWKARIGVNAESPALINFAFMGFGLGSSRNSSFTIQYVGDHYLHLALYLSLSGITAAWLMLAVEQREKLITLIGRIRLGLNGQH